MIHAKTCEVGVSGLPPHSNADRERQLTALGLNTRLANPHVRLLLPY